MRMPFTSLPGPHPPPRPRPTSRVLVSHGPTRVLVKCPGVRAESCHGTTRSTRLSPRRPARGTDTKQRLVAVVALGSCSQRQACARRRIPPSDHGVVSDRCVVAAAGELGAIRAECYRSDPATGASQNTKQHMERRQETGLNNSPLRVPPQLA